MIGAPDPVRYTRPTMRRRVFILSVLACILLSGCQRALFKPNEPRTQFQAYDRLRGRDAPLTEPDEFGNPRPALRARLGRR